MNPKNEGIGANVETLITEYLAAHVGISVPPGLYHRVINEVENALFRSVLRYTGNNQLQAAKILGINRNTLRKKITSGTTND